MNSCIISSNEYSSNNAAIYITNNLEISNSIIVYNTGTYIFKLSSEGENQICNISNCYLFNPEIKNISNKDISISIIDARNEYFEINFPNNKHFKESEIECNITNYPKMFAINEEKTFPIEGEITNFGLNEYINITAILDDINSTEFKTSVNRIDKLVSFIIHIKFPDDYSIGIHKIQLKLEGSSSSLTFKDNIEFQIIKHQYTSCINIYNVRLRRR